MDERDGNPRSGVLKFRFMLPLAVLAGWFPAVGQVRAQAAYTVAGVAVDATAETASEARKVARAAGQAEALDRLLKRLTPRARHDDIPVFEEDIASSLIASLEVEEEKISSTRYLAKLKYHFKKNDVRTLLRGLALPFSETQSKPALVLTVYEDAGVQNLWGDVNPWRDAWRGVDSRDRFVPLVLPKGDLADVGSVNVGQALAVDPTRLRTIAARYGVADVIVVHAVMERDLVRAVPLLTVSVQRMGPAGESSIVERFEGVSGNTKADLLTRGAQAIAISIEEEWKLATRLAFNEQGRLRVSVPLENLGQWIVLRRRLRKVAAIERFELHELTRTAARIVVHYLGDAGQLAVAMAQRDLKLAKEQGFWVVRLN